MNETLFARLKRHDDERPGFPGEHWMALAAGLWLLTRGQGTTLGRAASLAAGAALVLRAATGRDGIAGWFTPGPPARGARGRNREPRWPEHYLDLTAAWPERRRARVSAISQPIENTSPTP